MLRCRRRDGATALRVPRRGGAFSATAMLRVSRRDGACITYLVWCSLALVYLTRREATRDPSTQA